MLPCVMASRRRLQDLTPGRRKKRIEETIVRHSASRPENYDDILLPLRALEKPISRKVPGWKAQEQLNEKMSSQGHGISTRELDKIISSPPSQPESGSIFLNESPTKTLEGLAILREARRKRKLNENE